eukprot:scaffold246_cov364-Pavlova_lutheri.AAC.12
MHLEQGPPDRRKGKIWITSPQPRPGRGRNKFSEKERKRFHGREKRSALNRRDGRPPTHSHLWSQTTQNGQVFKSHESDPARVRCQGRESGTRCPHHRKEHRKSC